MGQAGDKIKKVILLEFIDEAKTFLGKYGKAFFLAEDTRVICLHPSVKAYLKERGVPSFDTLAYFDNEAQHRIILKTEELTMLLSERFSFRDKIGIEKGYRETFIHHVRLYFNHFFWVIEILKSIRQVHGGSRIYTCFPGDALKMYSVNAYIQDSERFLGPLAKDFCGKNNMEFCALGSNVPKKGLLDSFCFKLAGFASAIIARIIYSSLGSKKFNGRKVIVVPALSYRMGSLLDKIRSRNKGAACVMITESRPALKQELWKIYQIFANGLKKLKKENALEKIIFLDSLRNTFRKDSIQQKRISILFEEIVSFIQTDPDNLFVYDEVAVSPYLVGKASRGLRWEMLSLQHTTMVLYSVLKRLQPKLLMSMYSVGIYYMMGELSHILGFSSVDITHGTHVPPNNEFEKIENYRLATGVIINTYDYVAVQTPWAQKFLDYYEDKRPRIYSGPLIFSSKSPGARVRMRNEVLGLKNNEKVIVHATTQKLRHGMRFHIEETLDEYISGLADLVEAVNRLEGAHLIIRPHPACNITREEFTRLLPRSECLSILKKEQFSDILSAADILVSFSSTCIEEALQNKIPVILFDKWGRYNHFNVAETSGSADIVKKPVYYISSPLVLKECLPDILRIAGNNLLSDADLKEYRYPDGSGRNFDSFIDSLMEKQGAN